MTVNDDGAGADRTEEKTVVAKSKKDDRKSIRSHLYRSAPSK